MQEGRYLLNSDILAIYSDGGHRGPVYVPAGAIIVVSDEGQTVKPYVEVLWQGKQVKMFAQDILARTQIFRELPAQTSL